VCGGKVRRTDVIQGWAAVSPTQPAEPWPPAGFYLLETVSIAAAQEGVSKGVNQNREMLCDVVSGAAWSS